MSMAKSKAAGYLWSAVGWLLEALHSWRHDYVVYHDGSDYLGVMCLGCLKTMKVRKKEYLDALAATVEPKVREEANDDQ